MSLPAAIIGYPLAAIPWNLFLALIPCAIVWIMQRRERVPQSGWQAAAWFALAFIVWFVFLPNTAYLFTEVRHLTAYCDATSAYHVCRSTFWVVIVFFAYSLTGVPLFVYALRGMSRTLGARIHPALATWLPVLMFPATSVGVFLGLVERFNSWEILARPWSVVATGMGYFLDPTMLRNVVVFTMVLAGIYYGSLALLRCPASVSRKR